MTKKTDKMVPPVVFTPITFVPDREPDFECGIARFWFEEMLWAHDAWRYPEEFRRRDWESYPMTPLEKKVIAAYHDWLAEKELLR